MITVVVGRDTSFNQINELKKGDIFAIHYSDPSRHADYFICRESARLTNLRTGDDSLIADIRQMGLAVRICRRAELKVDF